MLSDDEREILTKLCIEHVAGKVPIIVTISHFSTDIAFKRAKLAKDVGANMVMMMPPYHGALLKGNDNQTFEQFRKVNEAGITIMVQDAPLSGVDLSVDLLVKMAKEIEALIRSHGARPAPLAILDGKINKSIMIGDSETDANAAKAAEIPIILLKYGYTEKKSNEIYHNHLVKNFVGIEKIIAEYL